MSGNSPSKLRQTELSHTAIVTIVTERILQGYYPEGSRLPTENALATEFGVSRWFVRRAFDQLTQEGLIERKDFHRPVVPIRDGFAFKRPELTENKSTQVIAAILPSHPICTGGLAIVAGITRTLSRSGSGLRAEIHDNSFQSTREAMLQMERTALENVRNSNNVAGLIWWCAGDADVAVAFQKARPDLPIVFIDRVPGDANVDFVGIDDVESAHAAVAHLTKIGHRRIAHVIDAGDYSTNEERARGYREAITASGGEVDPSLIVKLDWASMSGAGALDCLMSLNDPPTAIFTSNDYIAYSILDAAEVRKIDVPSELSVMGHGNLDQFSPRKFLSTVDQPFEMIGRMAARLIMRRIELPTFPTSTTQHVILPASVIVRRSTAEPAARPASRQADHHRD